MLVQPEKGHMCAKQCCRAEAGTAWSRHFQGGSGIVAGADFFIGRRSEPRAERLFQAAPAVSFRQAKKKGLVLLLSMNYELSYIYKDKNDPKHDDTI